MQAMLAPPEDQQVRSGSQAVPTKYTPDSLHVAEAEKLFHDTRRERQAPVVVASSRPALSCFVATASLATAGMSHRLTPAPTGAHGE